MSAELLSAGKSRRDHAKNENKVMVANGNGTGHERASQSAFGYFGSKQRLAKAILEYMPPHHCWVELFGGSLALTMTKTPAMIEVVNDLDDSVVNAFQQMRDHGDELAKLIQLTPYARSELKKAHQRLDEDNDLERARKFLVQAMMSVNGILAENLSGFSVSNTYAREAREARVNRWNNYPNKLKAVTSRLKGVRIEKKDGIGLLAEFSNRPATLVYIDPPYLADRSIGYNVEATDQDFHEHLLSQALLCKCMVMVSGYKSETYTKLLEGRGGWRKIKLCTTTQATNGDRLKRDEMLWINSPAEEALQSGHVNITLTKKEKKTGKVNPPRGPTRKCRRVWRTKHSP